MGIQLPTELSTLLSDAYDTWTNTDESGLLGMGHTYVGHSKLSDQPLDDARRNAVSVYTRNQKKGVEDFRAKWNEPFSPHANLKDRATGTTIIGTGLMVCAGVVLALKINIIVQPVQLAIDIAQAIAESAVTFGTSLLEIPVFKEITNRLMNLIANRAISTVMA